MDISPLDIKVTSRLCERLVPCRQRNSTPHGKLQTRRITGGQSLPSRERQNLPKRAGLRFGVGHDRQTTQELEMRRDLRAADALAAFGPCKDIAESGVAFYRLAPKAPRMLSCVNVPPTS